MRVIPTQVHGMVDYLMGVVLIASPWLFGFADGGAAMWVPIILGASVIVYSLLTAYELGVTPVISMSTHLILDAIGGAILAAVALAVSILRDGRVDSARDHRARRNPGGLHDRNGAPQGHQIDVVCRPGTSATIASVASIAGGRP